jgi:hypothetical protein
VAPAGTTTELGTDIVAPAAAYPSVTVVPGLEAAPARVTVQVEELGTVTLDGEQDKPESVKPG